MGRSPGEGKDYPPTPVLWLREFHGLCPWGCKDLDTTEQLSLSLSLVVQWLRLHTSNAGGAGSIPGQRTKIPYTTQCSQKLKKKKKINDKIYRIFKCSKRKHGVNYKRTPIRLPAVFSTETLQARRE